MELLQNFKAIMEICRACLVKDRALVNIFDGSQTLNISIADMISESTGFSVQKGDSLPEVICNPCLQDVQNAFEIKQTYERSYQLYCKGKEEYLEQDYKANLFHGQMKEEDIDEEFLDEDEELCKSAQFKKLNFGEKVNCLLNQLREADTQVHLQEKKLVKTSDRRSQRSNYVEKTINLDNQVKKQTIENDFLDKVLYHVKEEANEMEFLDEESSITSDCESQQWTWYQKYHQFDVQDLKELHMKSGKDKAGLEENKTFINDNIKVRNEPIYNELSNEDFAFDECTGLVNIKESKKSKRLAHNHPLKCSHCPKTYTYLSKLRIHLQTHTKERPHHCSYCPKTFASLYNLNQHLRIHNGSLFKCPQCLKCYPHKSTLKNHILTHNTKGTRKYKCSHCSKHFSFLNLLELHSLLHTDTRKHRKKCPHCPEVFSQNSVLTKHFLTHRQESPHQCSFCPLYFKNVKYLNDHIRTHIGKRPFQLVLSKDRQS
ncbi:zinc finger protein 132-like [Drosophila rhopaloa]|uniref:Zinc finger protein 132-like n=1 Tax=Drosophila rhopaloa TaxID=1041015 RepID=A0A6P4E823_DRORH|nr:zinc finger protein 132-like [Drosophila rhopaloa]